MAQILRETQFPFNHTSTGTFGFPKPRASGVMFAEMAADPSQHPASGLSLTRLVRFNQPILHALLEFWEAHQL